MKDIQTKYKDWEKNELINEIEKLKKIKQYGLVWDEKKTKENFAMEIKKQIPTLENISKNNVKTKSKLNNILIEGDNYHALSILNYTHKNKIDVIYIDPPYNIGGEFTYNDKIIDKDDSYRHSKWLSFMKKRLLLAKKLLSNKGVIFISIDDNEQSQLKLLCDQIFGERNFIEMLIIESNSRGSQAAKHFANVHEYILVYAKSELNLIIDGFVKNNQTISKDYRRIDQNNKKYRLLGLRQRGGEWRREHRKNMFYPIYVNTNDLSVSLMPTSVHTHKVLPKRPSGEDGRWTWAPSKARKNIHLLCGKKISRTNNDNVYDIFRINMLEDEQGNISRSKPKTIWTDKEINYQNGKTELKEMFAGKDVFEYPKPSYLIKKIISMFKKNNIVILDFFAGTGTTGNAVLQLNKEDGGNRKFILCTNNENKICSNICYPRLKKAIKGYKNSKNQKIDGFNGNLKYFKTKFKYYENTDENKKFLVKQFTDMLCLKEDCFDLISTNKKYQIFKNSDERYLGIIYYYDGIEGFKNKIKTIDKQINTYLFSFSDEIDTDEFDDLHSQVNLKPIPASVLNVYRRIFTHVQATTIPRKTHK